MDGLGGGIWGETTNEDEAAERRTGWSIGREVWRGLRVRVRDEG